MKTFESFISEMGDPLATNRMYAMEVHKHLQSMWTWMGENGLLEDPEYKNLISLLDKAKDEAMKISAHAQVAARF